MPESSDSLQNPRRGGFSLFRRSARGKASQSRRDASRWPPNDRGAVCQIGGTDSPKSNKPSLKGLDWLLGKRSGKAKDSNHHHGKVGNLRVDSSRSDQPLSSDITELDGRSNRFTPSSKRQEALRQHNKAEHSKIGRNGNGRDGNGRKENRRSPNRSQASSLKRGRAVTSTTPVESAHAIQSRSLVPFPRKSGRAETSRSGYQARRSETAIQSGQPTLMQQPQTTLQPQEAKNLKGRMGQRRKRDTEVSSRPRSRSMAIALYAARMLILSVGIGVLAGTVLSAWNPANNPFLTDASQPAIKPASSLPFKGNNPSSSGQLQLAQEIAPLKSAIQKLIPQYSGLTPGVFLIDLDSYNYVDLSGTMNFSAASMIKLPVLVAFFQDVDAGKIHLDEKLTLRKELIGSGSGELQGYPPGTQFTALDVVTKMITLSDNTATNILIDRLGGVQTLNQRFKSNAWGLSETSLNSVLPDLQGTNTTSPKEMASLMVRISQGEFVSLKSRDRLLDIMRRTINNSQLPPGLGEGATIAHKTGDIGKLIGDVGLVDMPNGKRYAIAVMVKCPFNDSRAYDLVQKVSRLTYQSLSGTSASSQLGAPSAANPLPSDTEETGTDPNASITPERDPSSGAGQ